MPLKRAVTEFGKTYKDRFALRTYPGTSVPIFIFILGWSRTKPRVTLSAQTMMGGWIDGWMNEAKEKNGGPEAKSTNKKKKQGAQVKIHKGKKKSIKKNSDATPCTYVGRCTWTR